MKAFRCALLVVAMCVTGLSLAGNPGKGHKPDHSHDHDRGHDHDHDHDSNTSGLIIESNSCAGLLGRAGEAGKFLIGSEEMLLSKKVVECNVCLEEGFTAETRLDDHSREEVLASIVEEVDGREGRRVGAKIYVTFYNQVEPIEFVCHFHSVEEGEIDCH